MEAARDGQVLGVKFAKQTYSDISYQDGKSHLFLCLDARTKDCRKILCASTRRKAIRIPMNDEHVRSLNVSATVMHDCL